jgi:hypothetical protein
MDALLRRYDAGLARCGAEVVERNLHECRERVAKLATAGLRTLADELVNE